MLRSPRSVLALDAHLLPRFMRGNAAHCPLRFGLVPHLSPHSVCGLLFPFVPTPACATPVLTYTNPSRPPPLISSMTRTPPSFFVRSPGVHSFIGPLCSLHTYVSTRSGPAAHPSPNLAGATVAQTCSHYVRVSVTHVALRCVRCTH